MRGLGFECVGQDVKLVDDVSLRVALKEIEAAGCDSLVMLQPSMGNGQLALSLAKSVAGADCSVGYAGQRPADGKVSLYWLVGQHLWASMMREAKHPFEFVYGDPDDAAVKATLVKAMLAHTAAVLKTGKVGMVGTHAPGFVDLQVKLVCPAEVTWAAVASTSLPQFIDRVRGVDARPFVRM